MITSMKRFFILGVLLILLLASSCSAQNSSYVFYKSYTSAEFDTLRKDFSTQLLKYDIDRTDLESWNSVQFETDEGYIKQRFITKQIDENKVYVFVWSSIVEGDSLYYEFKIREDDLK
jgi:hypothetical protein